MGEEDTKILNVGIIYSRFNKPVVKELLNSCVDQLIFKGVDEKHILQKEVPGALEIPIMINAYAITKKFDVLIGVGAVIRGETYHFEVVSDQSANGLMQVQLKHNIPVINAIITTNSGEEAFARTKIKGKEAADGAIEMAIMMGSV
ncbi:6,7-dimethyl-8-ribityllumazine synthase [Methylophilaceae bacterium]|nr:6,7-dimethyl-8-ribityllumazine synthase [Methylophilaceae bacterium]MDB2703240.1 6,7-dimethyl-8-ribityllumazine synthase [Methylophilaceae bacterium]